MVKRFYGGIISSTAVSVASTSASGFFNFSDQIRGRYTDAWPLVRPPEIQALIVGGGGGGGAAHAGGGGAGAVKTSSSYVLSGVSSISASIGSGGAAATGRPANGTNGGTSSITTFPLLIDNGAWLFNGSSDLSIPSSTGLNIGNTFTIEFWFYRTAGSADATIIQKGETDWRVSVASTGITFVSATSVSISTTINNNTWYHFAVTEDGTTLRCFLNGTLGASSLISGAPVTSTNAVSIGVNTASVGKVWYFTGYITNIRIVKGTALYTSSFTVPSTVPTNISGTTLLIAPTLTATTPADASGSNTITKNGVVAIAPINPLATATNTITAIGGGGGGSEYKAGSSGASGGGGATTAAGGTGTDGYNGGTSSVSFAGGGGGGAGTVGGNTVGTTAGNGGNGLVSSITGTSVTYAGGGGGGSYGGNGNARGTGGAGGGGNGNNGSNNGSAGTANTGGGGGGGGYADLTGYNGGSGVVIFRYPDVYSAATSTVGNPTYTVVNGYRIYSFTSTGILFFNM